MLMHVATKLQRGPVLKLIFSLVGFTADIDEQVSEIFNINDLAEVRFQCKRQCSNIIYNYSYKKHQSAMDYTVKLNITCKRVQYSKQCVCPEIFTDWVTMGKITKPVESTFHDPNRSDIQQYVCWGFDLLAVTLSVCKVPTLTFAKLFEDNEFCDFKLITNDGAVAVHKACLVLHSDMFRRMLSGQRGEPADNCIKIEGVKLKTLKLAKEYFYLGTLPDDTRKLKKLLLFSKRYMIDNLKTECMMKIAHTVRPEDLFSLQKFAVDNRIPELLTAILQITPNDTFRNAHLRENKNDDGPSKARTSSE